MTREKMFGSYQSRKVVLNHLPCSFSFTVVAALPSSHCDTCNKFTFSKQVKHKWSILCGTRSKMFESRKLSPKLCISALPSHLPVVQRSQRTCFTAAFPLAQPGRAPSLFFLTLCPHWVDTLGTGSVSPNTTTRRTSQKEPFVAGTQAQEQLSQQLPQSLCMGIAATPVTASPSWHLTFQSSLGTSFCSLH